MAERLANHAEGYRLFHGILGRVPEEVKEAEKSLLRQAQVTPQNSGEGCNDT